MQNKKYHMDDDGIAFNNRRDQIIDNAIASGILIQMAPSEEAGWGNVQISPRYIEIENAKKLFDLYQAKELPNDYLAQYTHDTQLLADLEQFIQVTNEEESASRMDGGDVAVSQVDRQGAAPTSWEPPQNEGTVVDWDAPVPSSTSEWAAGGWNF